MSHVNAVRCGNTWLVTYCDRDQEIEMTALAFPNADYSYPVPEGKQLVKYSRYCFGVWWKAPRTVGKNEK